MEKRELGKSGVWVTPVGLGTNAVGGHNIYNYMTDDAGREILRTALENGVDFLDTAYYYGLGRSEELIGEIVKTYGKRNEVVIATKGAHRMLEDQLVMDNSVDFIVQSVYDSLERLQTDYIDVFYVHYPDKETPKYEVTGALRALKDKGVIRAIGVSNFTMEQLEEANRDGNVDVIQNEYNLFRRQAETDFIPYALSHDIAFIPYYPLALGLLTGKFNRDSTFMDARSKHPLYKGKEFLSNLDRVERIRHLAKAKGIEMTNLVLAWYLRQEGVSAVIPGAKHGKQVICNMNSLEVELTDAEAKEIGEIFRAHEMSTLRL
ncbi:MAG TPA: aldo/keto reductase [Clostridiaceae bacterium]|nr:aldo/keto reductase [Clostridiaceae bacterium]